MLIVLTIAIGLTPAALSLFVCLYSRQRFQQNLHLATDYAAQERFRQRYVRPRDPDEHYVDGIGLVIGDITCRLNARSPFLRCATNPTGPCEDCREYDPKEYESIDH
ncbi:MAG: hypothetical protein HLUCCA11_02755 [Phormidesmis priestleyi Ana]|uniref:Uncharacterized protein n=1 Tax=Phormidesmis priestleyi Ana TaxID=1666911 RepID=A0A0P8C6H5_9CYAN|nr:MAG: hypothetical protein HLUCCA11_02755 [Phormidesmis priestleyi Ana]